MRFEHAKIAITLLLYGESFMKIFRFTWAFVLAAALLAASGGMASAQDTSKFKAEDQSELVAPETSNMKPDTSRVITSNESKLIKTDEDPALSETETSLTRPDQSTLTPTKESRIKVEGGAIELNDQSRFKTPRETSAPVFSDQSTRADANNSNISVSSGSLETSDSSEMKTTEDSNIRAKDK